MDTSIPNAVERKKLQKTIKFYHHLPVYSLVLFSTFWIADIFFEKSPALGTLINGLIAAAMIYLLLVFVLLKKCPRCSSWGTTIMAGNCPKCGLSMDPSEQQ